MIGTKFVLNRFFFDNIFFVLSFYFKLFFLQYCHTRAPSWIFSLAENLVCKMEPRSGYIIMQPEPSSLLDQSEISAGLQDARWSHKVAPNLTALTNLA